MLNLTTHVRDGRGWNICISATWNAATPIDEAPLVTLYASLFSSLYAQGDRVLRESGRQATE